MKKFNYCSRSKTTRTVGFENFSSRLWRGSKNKAFTLIELPVVRKRAFTLIELLVVIAVIGILAAIVLMNVETANATSRDAQRKKDLTLIVSALENYKATSKVYITSSGSGANFDPVTTDSSSVLYPLKSDGYITALPTDPNSTSSTPKYYQYRGTSSDYKVTASSERIGSSDDITTAKNKAGDFYNSVNKTLFQISSSYNSNGW